ncbi:MAG: efflux RND transporter periplasmic adaptor subunit, partial [Calditrichaeota bacterium]
MKQISLFILALALAAILTGCGAKSKAVKEEAKIPVSVTAVKLGTVEQSLIYNGDIEAEFAVKVFSKIPDRIESFSVDEGDFIEKGKPIAKILATTIEQGVLQAQAGVTALRAQESNLALEFERSSRLFREGALSKQQFDAIETQFKAIRAQVEQAEAASASASASLGDATITAPFSGIISKRYLEVGDMVSPGMPLVEIVQME